MNINVDWTSILSSEMITDTVYKLGNNAESRPYSRLYVIFKLRTIGFMLMFAYIYTRRNHRLLKCVRHFELQRETLEILNIFAYKIWAWNLIILLIVKARKIAIPINNTDKLYTQTTTLNDIYWNFVNRIQNGNKGLHIVPFGSMYSTYFSQGMINCTYILDKQRWILFLLPNHNRNPLEIHRRTIFLESR